MSIWVQHYVVRAYNVECNNMNIQSYYSDLTNSLLYEMKFLYMYFVYKYIYIQTINSLSESVIFSMSEL